MGDSSIAYYPDYCAFSLLSRVVVVVVVVIPYAVCVGTYLSIHR